MSTRPFTLLCVLYAAVNAACTSTPDPAPEPGAPVEPGSVLLAHAAGNATFVADLATFRDQGWQVSELAAATTEMFDAPAAADDGMAASSAIATWSRVRVGATLAPPSGGGVLRIALAIAWTGGQPDQIALVPDSEAAEASALEAMQASAGSLAGAVHPLASIGSPCHSNGDCGSTGLTCFGPDNHETCQCSSASTFTTHYTISRGSGHAGCRDLDNPGGGFHVVKTVRGCGNGLLSDACGNTRSVPANITSSRLDIMCGFNC